MTNVREELRVVEDRIAQLREENAALQRQVMKPTGLRNWTIAALLAAGLTGASAFVVADRAGSLHARSELERATREHERRLEREGTAACELLLQELESNLASCERTPPGAAPPSPPPRRQPNCACEAGDPLCSCR